jgi:hypothetical protein
MIALILMPKHAQPEAADPSIVLQTEEPSLA